MFQFAAFLAGLEKLIIQKWNYWKKLDRTCWTRGLCRPSWTVWTSGLPWTPRRLGPSGPFELLRIIELQTNLTFQKITANRGSNKINGYFLKFYLGWIRLLKSVRIQIIHHQIFITHVVLFSLHEDKSWSM